MSFRPILPQPERLPSVPPPPPEPKKKRHLVAVACNVCRSRKVKCDAKQPTCGPCAKHGVECVYAERTTVNKRKFDELEDENRQLQSSRATLEDLTDAIRHSSPRQVNAIIAQIRQGFDVGAALRRVGEGDLLLQLHTAPQTSCRFSLRAGADMPVYLHAPDNHYLRSALHRATLETDQWTEGRPHRAFTETSHPEYFKPLLAAKIADPRLENVRPSAWTNVSVDDGLLRALLRQYFQYEYQWLCCFHKDHFLDSMLSGSTKYCSALLVNSVLALACECFQGIQDRLEYWNPMTLGYQFLAEAKRLWELEKDEKNSVTTIQAALVINVVMNMQSMDKLGMTYTFQGLAIAHRLQLFGPLTHLSKKKQESYAFTAWCLYFWLSLSAYHFIVPPLVQEPPAWPLPDVSQDGTFYPELWLQYPLSEDLRCMEHGYLFKAKMELIGIINRFSTKVFGDKKTYGREPSTKLLHEYIHCFQKWFSSLPAPISASWIVYPTHLKLHLLYYNVMIDICQLLVTRPDAEWNVPGCESPRQLLEQSKACSETLIRLYYLRHSFEASDTYLTHSLMMLAFAAIGEKKLLGAPSDNATSTRGEELQNTMVLAAKGLSDQGKNFYVSLDVLNVVRNTMETADVAALDRHIGGPDRNDKESTQLRTRHIQAQYPLNIVRVTEHPDEQRLGALIKEYSDLSIEACSAGSESGDSSAAGA